ncbi:hypothetical protein M3N55_15555 [Roseibaca sp. V10]|uniref:Uncharacterized protein n=1 Tax=Roseinatronobacter domitianus TaxID=2940293 RepID=A0ABT0M5K6_9RHOB|nr:hypothetical protein [Roseibaca domitiana]MCL1630140.1 hypothetical protein [Roseibaca domitiana]
MARTKFKGAPQLSRIFDEIDVGLVSGFLATRAVPDVFPSLRTGEPANSTMIQSEIENLTPDDLKAVELQALRVTKMAEERADLLHLRLADSPSFDCYDELADLPGPLARAVWSFSEKTDLFIATERAIYVRGHRENKRHHQGFELVAPHSLMVNEIQNALFAQELSLRLQLRDGCQVEAIEIPAGENIDREIMVTVTMAGARASHRTFEANQTTDYVHFRPASDLILVYRPDMGRIEICGRQWNDRRLAAETFARTVLGEDLSARPLIPRNYDLSVFRGDLRLDVPVALQDRILKAEVTEVRVALGNYDQKITLTVSPGHDIETLRRSVFGRLGSARGRGFVCNVELYLTMSGQSRQTKALRFRIDNHNSSTLQGETDPELRALGFRFLEEIGVVKPTRIPSKQEEKELLPVLLTLLDHPADTVSEPELEQMGIDPTVLTDLEYLHRREFVDTMVIDDDDLGPVDADVLPELAEGIAVASIVDGTVDRYVGLAEVSRWSINRDYIAETVRQCFDPLELSGPEVALNANLTDLGLTRLADRNVRIRFAYALSDASDIDRVDGVLRLRAESAEGLVLVPGERPLDYLGSNCVVSVVDILDADSGKIDPKRLAACFLAAERGMRAGARVKFDKKSDALAQLVIPGRPVWTIKGQKKVLIVERLHQAYVTGEGIVATDELQEYAGVLQLGPTFGPEWATRIKGTYIHSPGRKTWALAVSPHH